MRPASPPPTHVHICMSPFFIPFQNNATPLFVASQKGYHDVVQSLLGAGADVNTATSDVSNHILYLWSDETRNVRKLRKHTIPSTKLVVHTAMHRCTYMCVCIDEQLDACSCKKYI